MPRPIFFTFIFLLAFSQYSSAASFNCNVELNHQEKVICGNKTISKLDEEMGALYKQTMEKVQPNIYVKISQLQWLSRTRNPCKEENCIKLAYEKRNSDLLNWNNSKNSLFISILGKWKSTITPTEGAAEIIYENKIVPLIDNNPSNYFEVFEISENYIVLKMTDAPNISSAYIKYSIQNEISNFNTRGQYTGGLFVEGFASEEALRKNSYSFQESMAR